jgi:hypothetical protein
MIGVTVERTVTKDHMQCECPDMDVQKSKCTEKEAVWWWPGAGTREWGETAGECGVSLGVNSNVGDGCRLCALSAYGKSLTADLQRVDFMFCKLRPSAMLFEKI